MVRPRKSLGQHFLHDAATIQRILRAIRPHPEDALVEIGPGTGALTLPLLEAAGQLDAIELDQRVLETLARRASHLGTLRLHHADALTVDLTRLRQDRQKLRLVGNLPYNISTPLLFHLLGQAEHILDMHFMLQKEVVMRMAAVPGNRDYGRLSVMVQYYCQVEQLFSVEPEAFVPPPKVDSAVVRLLPKTPLPARDPALEQVVRQAFAQRRKTLRNSLSGLLDSDAIEAAGVDPRQRPEELDLHAFIALGRSVA